MLIDGELTPNGEQFLLESISIDDEVTHVVDRFEEFWNTFPKSDEFRSYPRTRTLRYNKQLTKEEYAKALNKVTHEQLMTALRNEIATYETGGENGFKYMRSSPNWLAKESYWDYLDEDIESKNEYGKEIV